MADDQVADDPPPTETALTFTDEWDAWAVTKNYKKKKTKTDYSRSVKEVGTKEKTMGKLTRIAYHMIRRHTIYVSKVGMACTPGRSPVYITSP